MIYLQVTSYFNVRIQKKIGEIIYLTLGMIYIFSYETIKQEYLIWSNPTQSNPAMEVI